MTENHPRRCAAAASSVAQAASVDTCTDCDGCADAAMQKRMGSTAHRVELRHDIVEGALWPQQNVARRAGQRGVGGHGGVQHRQVRRGVGDAGDGLINGRQAAAESLQSSVQVSNVHPYCKVVPGGPQLSTSMSRKRESVTAQPSPLQMTRCGLPAGMATGGARTHGRRAVQPMPRSESMMGY